MMKKILLILKPLLLCLFGLNLRTLKSLFVTENKGLRESLRKNNFHLALCSHPSILFGCRENNYYCTTFLNWKIKFVSQCVRIKILTTNNGHKLLNKLGIDLHFGNGVEFWFEESHSPIVPYSIPTSNVVNQKLIAVYTALTGNYDNVNEILYKEDNVDYFLFTNNPSITSNTWQVVYVDNGLENQLLSRHIKMFPQKYLDSKYEISIYIDASAVIYGEISQLVKYLNDKVSFAVSKHSVRNTLKEEFDACVAIKKIDQSTAILQYNRYVAEGIVDNIPLVECGILVRRHNDEKLQQLMQCWYEEFKNGIHRDQLSLLPMIKKNNFMGYVIMDGSVWHNQFNKIVAHKL